MQVIIWYLLLYVIFVVASITLNFYCRQGLLMSNTSFRAVLSVALFLFYYNISYDKYAVIIC